MMGVLYVFVALTMISARKDVYETRIALSYAFGSSIVAVNSRARPPIFLYLNYVKIRHKSGI